MRRPSPGEFRVSPRRRKADRLRVLPVGPLFTIVLAWPPSIYENVWETKVVTYGPTGQKWIRQRPRLLEGTWLDDGPADISGWIIPPVDDPEFIAFIDESPEGTIYA